MSKELTFMIYSFGSLTVLWFLTCITYNIQDRRIIKKRDPNDERIFNLVMNLLKLKAVTLKVENNGEIVSDYYEFKIYRESFLKERFFIYPSISMTRKETDRLCNAVCAYKKHVRELKDSDLDRIAEAKKLKMIKLLNDTAPRESGNET